MKFYPLLRDKLRKCYQTMMGTSSFVVETCCFCEETLCSINGTSFGVQQTWVKISVLSLTNCNHLWDLVHSSEKGGLLPSLQCSCEDYLRQREIAEYECSLISWKEDAQLISVSFFLLFVMYDAECDLFFIFQSFHVCISKTIFQIKLYMIYVIKCPPM